MTFTDQMLVERWPLIPWCEPICINATHYACRICIARYGLKGAQISGLPTDADAVRAHISACHPTLMQ